MIITSDQIWAALITATAIIIGTAAFAYWLGLTTGYDRAEADRLDPGPLPATDLTIRLKHVPPSTAELFRQLEAVEQRPLAELVRAPRYADARTTDFIQAICDDTTDYIERMRG